MKRLLIILLTILSAIPLCAQKPLENDEIIATVGVNVPMYKNMESDVYQTDIKSPFFRQKSCISNLMTGRLQSMLQKTEPIVTRQEYLNGKISQVTTSSEFTDHTLSTVPPSNPLIKTLYAQVKLNCRFHVNTTRQFRPNLHNHYKSALALLPN